MMFVCRADGIDICCLNRGNVETASPACLVVRNRSCKAVHREQPSSPTPSPTYLPCLPSDILNPISSSRSAILPRRFGVSYQWRRRSFPSRWTSGRQLLVFQVLALRARLGRRASVMRFWARLARHLTSANDERADDLGRGWNRMDGMVIPDGDGMDKDGWRRVTDEEEAKKPNVRERPQIWNLVIEAPLWALLQVSLILQSKIQKGQLILYFSSPSRNYYKNKHPANQ